MRKENSQMPGALILRFTGLRDEISTCRCLVLSAAFLRCHPQDPESYSVRECFECCSMCREFKAKNHFHDELDCQRTLPATRRRELERRSPCDSTDGLRTVHGRLDLTQ